MSDKELTSKDLPYKMDGKVYDYCPVCMEITEQCQYYVHWNRENRCIKCNGGTGYTNECNNCYHDQN